MKPNTKTFAIIWLIVATVFLFSCKKEDSVTPSNSAIFGPVPNEYQSPDTGAYSMYNRYSYYLDSSGVSCGSKTDTVTDGFVFVIKSDTTFELQRHDRFVLGVGKYTFSSSDGEIIIPDGIVAITAPYYAGGQSWPGYMEDTKVFFKNEKIPYDTTVLVSSSGNVIYFNTSHDSPSTDCGNKIYIQERLKR